MSTTIRSTKARSRRYYQRNKVSVRAKQQRVRATKQTGPRVCARCGMAPSVSRRHRYCESCKAIVAASRRGFPERTGTTTEQGYGAVHVRLRRKVAKIVTAGDAYCARCGGHIAPDAPWHLDHADDRSGYLGPSHAGCNVRAGASKGARVARSHEPEGSRAWL